ncbi:HAD family hydrolase [Botrimarina hoheduenensis]|uniref:Haloacid dehalogenase-like hydrolase n=1 Tax=Botrimarina hoheduenensis TaxID=2528000 RepID=A0A5C5VT11_9BACT|nr:HAD family hydrolase [Botrimarina hoheduenensis]TWT40749.1 haloacid dehalogenase-like hydrolase [Botrimarina hoheduenensis]
MRLFSVCVTVALFFLPMVVRASDPLPSWAEGPAKESILGFIQRVSAPGSPEEVPASERIAVFDNDGTLWSEQPMYVQAFFAFDRVRQLAPEHPEWREREPFASILRGDLATSLQGGEPALLEIIMATHAGLTTDEFDRVVSDWISEARHPVTKRRFTQMVYLPMLEILAHLRKSGFKTFIVSGGGIDFMRPWAEAVYGVPPEQVVGSSIRLAYQYRDGSPVIERLAEIDFIDDKVGKPVGIQQHIGRRPILAFGNSDGDYQMLEWTTAGSGPRLGVLIHHTDNEREQAYDRDSLVGRLDRALREAPVQGWAVIDMKRDWRQIYPASVQP